VAALEHNPQRTERRLATENRLLDALETVLIRDGLRHLSLNAIVEEAGVSKPLLYRYFDNLLGLLTAWVERRGGLPTGVDASPAAAGQVPELDDNFRRQVADGLVQSAESLRRQPIILEMLAEELTADSEISVPFAKARRKQGQPFLRAMLADQRYVEPEIRGKIIVLYAAISYLAMRAARSPNYMGLRLDTDEGWAAAMAMIRRLAIE
jgi:AcrR family transcriptional regulator